MRHGTGTTHRSGWRAHVGLLALSIGISVLAAEGISRIAFPISPGSRNLTYDGDEISPYIPGSLRMKAGLRYRQVSNEYDVETTIDRFGNRVPEPHVNPEIVFLGDSFTFGQGIADQDTFPFIFCKRERLSCANLGRNGTGTGRQLDVLEHYLSNENWRPREVRIFVLAMTGALMPGNDLLDNYYYSVATNQRSIVNSPQEQISTTTDKQILSSWAREVILENSNLARTMYFALGPWLRAFLSPYPNSNLLVLSIKSTKEQFDRLDNLSRHFLFSYKIYIIYPVQDLIRGSYMMTFHILKSLSENSHVIDTSSLFIDNPSNYYFPYDGHFTPAGSRKLAASLVPPDRD
jgi:hypothetical protein